MTPDYACPLCRRGHTQLYHQDSKRNYYQCQQCALVFVEPCSLPKPDEEKALYECHENHVDDPGYRKFLNKLVAPLMERIQPASQGLDFGCGPGPALAAMLGEAGHRMAVYDPFFADSPEVLDQTYDFVTCTEAIEHFHVPAKEWQLLLSMVKPGGYLGIMTKLVLDAERFASWHYKLDPTHVSFFSRATFEFLAQRDGLMLEFVADDALLLRKERNR